MKKVSALIVFVGVLAVAACSSTGGGEGGGDGCGGGGTDATQSTIESYVDGTRAADNTVTVHGDVQEGQYWETTMDSNGMTMITRWQVASKDGDMAVVEQQNKLESEYSSHNYVLAYEVDLTAEGPNVTRAWIGKPGEAPTELEVPEPQDGPTGDTPEMETTTEDFEREIAGGNWEGTLTTTVMNGSESKTWVADNGWFNGMVRNEAGGIVTELTSYGTDAEPLLAWE